MNNVAILDKMADNLARDFNEAAGQRGLQLRFVPFTELAHLYARLDEGSVPALILLHHTWDGLDTATIVNHIAIHAGQSRVVVFTGRDLNLPELMQCIRSGVADYWEKGKHTVDFMLQRIVQYCTDSNVTLARLQMASQPMRQLLEAAQRLDQRVHILEAANADLNTQLRRMQSHQQRQIVSEHVRTVRFILYLAAFTASSGILKMWFGLETWAVLVLISLAIIFLLFIDGKVSSALLRWTGGSVDLRGSGDRDKADGSCKPSE